MTRTRRALLACALVAASVGAAAPALAKGPPLAAEPISRLNLPWWAARHQAKLVEAKQGPVGLVWLGDSITQQFESADYLPTWQRFYGDRHALNLGFSGDATSHLLWRIDHGEVAGITPRVAIILIGANNLGRLHWETADDILGIEAVVARTQAALPRTKILLLGILPSDRGPWVLQTTAQANAALAERYGHGATPGVTFMDLSGLFMHGGVVDDSQFHDIHLTPPEPALHPSGPAQAQMAAAIEPTVAALMGDRDHR